MTALRFVGSLFGGLLPLLAVLALAMIVDRLDRPRCTALKNRAKRKETT